MGAIWVGVDVSKQRLDVAIRPAGETLTISNDDAGIKNIGEGAGEMVAPADRYGGDRRA